MTPSLVLEWNYLASRILLLSTGGPSFYVPLFLWYPAEILPLGTGKEIYQSTGKFGPSNDESQHEVRRIPVWIATFSSNFQGKLGIQDTSPLSTGVGGRKKCHLDHLFWKTNSFYICKIRKTMAKVETGDRYQCHSLPKHM